MARVRLEPLHVRCKRRHVILPVGAALRVQVLLEDAGPLPAADVLFDRAHSLRAIHSSQVQLVGELDVGLELLPSLVVFVFEGAALILNHARKPIHVVNSGGSGDFSTVTVAANSRHRQLIRVHEPDDIVRHLIHVVGRVMVRLALVAIVEKPDVAHAEDLVFAIAKPFTEVLGWLRELWQPNHSWQVGLTTLQEGTLKIDLSSVRLHRGLCNSAARGD